MPTSNVSDTETLQGSAQELARTLLTPGWPRVRRIPLIRREIRESLSENALEILFSGGELIVEGGREGGRQGDQGDWGGDAADRAYATVMLTLDLSRSATLLREPADEATALRVAELMRGHSGVRRRLTELARPRLAALFEAEASRLRIELVPAVRVEGVRVLIDGDVVVSVSTTRRRGQVAR